MKLKKQSLIEHEKTSMTRHTMKLNENCAYTLPTRLGAKDGKKGPVQQEIYSFRAEKKERK
jgi:hypothetical protein